MCQENLNESVMVMGSPETCTGFFGETAMPEIYDEFLCFRCVELEVVIKAPDDLLKVSVFVVVGYKSSYSCVIRIFKNGD